MKLVAFYDGGERIIGEVDSYTRNSSEELVYVRNRVGNSHHMYLVRAKHLETPTDAEETMYLLQLE